jgi:hypothetical protein
MNKVCFGEEEEEEEEEAVKVVPSNPSAGMRFVRYFDDPIVMLLNWCFLNSLQRDIHQVCQVL